MSPSSESPRSTSAVRRVLCLPDPATLAAAVAARLVVALCDAQADRGAASLVLTGGGIGVRSLAALADAPALGALDPTRLDVWWGDERFVAPQDADRNDRQAREALRGVLDGARQHPIGDRGSYPDADRAAAAYAETLLAAGGGVSPAFDVLLLGIGPEGHVASIFPGSPAATDDRPVLAVHDSPKPPPVRVSLGFPAIRRARQVWVLASGSAKADAVARLLAGADPVELPAAGAVGTEQTLLLADRAALRR